MAEITPPIRTDIDVLREMVRLAERRREEELRWNERVNQYNFAMIAFAGSFLTLLVGGNFSIEIVRIAGSCLVVTIILSIITIRPRILKGGTLLLDEDVKSIREGKTISLQEFLLSSAEILDQAATKAGTRALEKKQYWTIYSAIFLALALIATYILYAYA